MMTSIDFPWIAITAVLGFVVTVLLIVFKEWLSNNKKILDALQDLKLEVVRQNEKLKTLFHQNLNLKAELKALEKKVEKIEHKQTACGNCEHILHRDSYNGD